jgi:hypothetical protein
MIRQAPEDFSTGTKLRQIVLTAAFRELLEHDEPASLETLAARTGLEPATVAETLDDLRGEGRVVIAADGRVNGIAGLSVVPTRHEIHFDGKHRWTWCAYDAVGILSALAVGGVARSTSLFSGDPIEVAFEAGRPARGDVVLFISTAQVNSVVDDWCPQVNFFESADAALAWKAEAAAQGDVLELETAARTGGDRWREFLPER